MRNNSCVPYRRCGCVLLAMLVLALESVIVCLPWLTRVETAFWLNDHVADHSHIVADLAADEVENLIDKNLLGRKLFGTTATTWSWQFTAEVESQSPAAWLAQSGAHYLVIDERTMTDESFSRRIQGLESQGATLIYQTSSTLSLPRQAVLWTFRPEHILNITFDGDFLLVGYNVSTSATGAVTLLFHWYTERPAEVPYHIFIHQLDPITNRETELMDAVVGGDTHPTNTWRKGEIVFDSIPLAKARLDPGERLRIGLYVFDTGARAPITDSQQDPIGDHIDLNLSS